jgi:predicted nucleic acid-binding protein
VTVIIDASVLCAFILTEDGHEDIQRLLLRGTISIELVVIESCNAILTALKRGRLRNDEAGNAVKILLSYVGSNVKILPVEDGLVSDSYEIAKENSLASCDAMYIALAKHLRGSLASRDPRQLEVAKRYGIRTVAP